MSGRTARPSGSGEPRKQECAKGGPIHADRLKSFIERIEKLEEERKAIGGDIKDVYSEAKGVGYDVKTMRKIVALRSQDSADRAEAETLLDIYKHALGMETSGTVTVQAPPVSEEELEARAGRIVAEVDRCMDLVTDGRTPKIEAIQDLIGCSSGKAHKLRKFVAERISRQMAQTRESENPPEIEETAPQGSLSPETPRDAADPALQPVPDGGVGAGTHSETPLEIDQSEVQKSCGGVEGHAEGALGEGNLGESPVGPREVTGAVEIRRAQAPSPAGVESGPQDPTAEHRPIPPFLRSLSVSA